ncbi:glycoside hydrolase family 20 zincin-like fold domain-containing protein [Devosia sp. CN2-171]|uniref:glycoside hydrolase family 20 zincin-like fold domain-containing protein n=1 Tax=Devosia sp. CN2-171 TaxID=3400909 RepID=UPI003BF8DE6D
MELVSGPGGRQGYSIDFTRERARVTAETETGALYGLVTLGQILHDARLHLRQFCFPPKAASRMRRPWLGAAAISMSPAASMPATRSSSSLPSSPGTSSTCCTGT